MHTRISKVLFALGVLATAELVSRPARACGATVGGVPGLCDIGAKQERDRSKVSFGLVGTYTNTALLFSGDSIPARGRATQTRNVASIVLEARPSPRVALQFAGGGLLGGTLDYRDRNYALQPGLALAVAASYVLVVPTRVRPFVVGGAQLAMLATETARTRVTVPERTSYTAFDLRLTAAAGYRVANAFSPYAVGRIFGGPIFWRVDGAAARGTDLYKYQLGLGASLTPHKSIALFAEGIFVGERGVTAGISITQ
jgi:hypothetical protein